MILSTVGAIGVVGVTIRVLWRQLRSYEGQGVNKYIDNISRNTSTSGTSEKHA
ncbi:hypothetical protein SAMN05444487_1187 [Marininema mesophilum]|uniref:Uncharacterized protein n=1 Tax=Marininema mesophilum TaxID=1048340 RepID=A0A1H3BRV3_9BACL|nr:hypothetical protein SAMN05444487_1187 [Marininema mesophilum]